MIETMIVIAKEPVPGRVKTRLVPPLSYQQAADVAAACLADTLDAVDALRPPRRLLALEGQPGPWLPAGWQVEPQPSGGLDLRLVAAFAAAGPGPALLVGMDTPQATSAQLAAFDPDRFGAALGLAEDGGFWALGLRDPSRADEVIRDVPMSTAQTGTVQLSRLRSAGLSVQLLDQLTDIDTIAAGHAVAAVAPATRFARLLARIAEPVTA